MFADPNIVWKPYSSILDGVENVDVTLLYAACASALGLIAELSSWRDGKLAELYTVRFSEPLAWLGMDETIYSIAFHGSDEAKRPGRALRISERSNLKAQVAEIATMIGHRPSAKHFLIAGLNTCLEVISLSDPEVRLHDDSGAAMAWMREVELELS